MRARFFLSLSVALPFSSLCVRHTLRDMCYLCSLCCCVAMQKRTAPQRYASCILRLEQLTPHQKEKVQELFDADEVRNGSEKTARPFRSVCPEPVLASDCTCRIRKEGSRENGAVFLNVMSGAEPPHQGGGRHGQDFRCAFDCDAEFSFCFPKKRTILCQDRLGTSAQRRKRADKRRAFFGFFLVCAFASHHTVAMIFLLEKVRMRKTHDVFCDPFYTQNDASFCQDRLGTNI
jgi:hypothetical protein